MSVWDGMTPAGMFNLTPAVPAHARADGAPRPLALATGPGVDDGAPAWHPDNALFWFGVLAAATLGLIGASTSFRVGPAKVAAAVGNP
jgi:hypothetical protein